MLSSTLTVVILTMNEEKNIRQCVESVRPVATDILVFDSGSQDRTVAIAESLRCRVVHQPFSGFASQRNAAREHCEGDWILMIDADERLDEELIRSIQNLLNDLPKETVFKLDRKNIIWNKWLKYSCGKDYQIRLFKNHTGFRYCEQEIHEKLDVMGRTVGVLSGYLIHRDQGGLVHFINKLNHYTDLEASEILKDPPRLIFLRMFVAPCVIFFRRYIRSLGFLDGLRGFLLSLLASFYGFVKYFKVYESIKGWKVCEKESL
ncbi:MAG: glycosyltransferase family 2 protein [Candidatus Margulisiibacteriota bacterium]